MNENNSNNLGFPMGDPIKEEMILKYSSKRTIILYDEVDRESIFKCLYYLDKIVAQDKILGTKEPITILISSYGGYCYHGLELASRIEQLKEDGYTIIGICRGVAMSMASVILTVCSIRKMYRYGCILIHQVSSGSEGELKRMEEAIDETKRLWELSKDIYLRTTNIPKEKLDEIYKTKTDWHIDAETALKFNIVDEIL